MKKIPYTLRGNSRYLMVPKDSAEKYPDAEFHFVETENAFVYYHGGSDSHTIKVIAVLLKELIKRIGKP